MFAFYRVEDLFQRSHIGPVTFKHFVRKRKTFLGHDQSKDNLASISLGDHDCSRRRLW